MHTPLEPPPGFQHEASLRGIAPGLDVTPIRSPEHFMRVLRAAWKLYKHQYIPDPELVAEEKAKAEEEARVRDVADRKRRRKEEEALREARDLGNIAYDALPKSKEDVQNRLDVINASLDQFMKGFNEVLSGETSIFGNRSYNETLVREDNKPVIYVVEEIR